EWPRERRGRGGTVEGGLVSPSERSLAVGSYGWSPATAGVLRARVVDLGVVSTAAPALPPEVNGAAVVIEPTGTPSDAGTVIRTYAARRLAAAGAAAMLIPANKPGRMVY